MKNKGIKDSGGDRGFPRCCVFRHVNQRTDDGSLIQALFRKSLVTPPVESLLISFFFAIPSPPKSFLKQPVNSKRLFSVQHDDAAWLGTPSTKRRVHIPENTKLGLIDQDAATAPARKAGLLKTGEPTCMNSRTYSIFRGNSSQHMELQTTPSTEWDLVQGNMATRGSVLPAQRSPAEPGAMNATTNQLDGCFHAAVMRVRGSTATPPTLSRIYSEFME
ncbi:MAG: hypothetical protein J3Q66DRAFT_400331 [Benniella sp.]|nr:MAG: hypothetical protein J3Q66DRAFT_400331 [Benniella sp.]